jgi:3-oxoacyl-[acyl-carrier protein] reductase
MTSDPNQWQDKVAVVTGASGAMGRAVCDDLIELGVRVAGLDLADSPVESMGGDRFLPIATDIGDHAQIVRAFEKVDAQWGRVDYLVNLAAVNSSPNGIADVDENDLARTLAINLCGTYWACQEAVRRMKLQGGGSIVNISSLNGYMGRRQFPTHAYAASKGGVIGLTRSLAGEVGAYGIRVNCVAPGLHLSPLAHEVAGSEEGRQSFFANAIESTPLKRIADASEMAGPIAFFLSDASRYMTGQVVASDGGRASWYV